MSNPGGAECRIPKPRRPDHDRIADADWDAYVQAVVDAAPPLTEEQRAQLARLLRRNPAPKARGTAA